VSWARIDDQFAEHPKVRSLGLFGLALQASAICYCARYSTDGFMSYSAADLLVGSITAPFTLPDGRVCMPSFYCGHEGKDAAAADWKALMVEVGLWEKVKGGFHVHDFLDYNLSRAQIATFKEQGKKGARLRYGQGHRQDLANAIAISHAPTPTPKNKKRLTPLTPQGGQLTLGVNPLDARTWEQAAWGTPEALAHLYNERSPDQCRPVKVLSPALRERAAKFLKDFPQREWWEQVFTEISNSPFLLGQMPASNGYRKFRFDFDFLFKTKDGQEHAVNIYNGGYRHG
jgi:hypothetical protein